MIEFRISRDIAEYVELVDGLQDELGPRFARSVENWCGIGERPYPLPVWEVYLVGHKGRTVGLCSLYKHLDDSQGRMWVGWIGVLREHRRMGLGRAMLRFVEQKLREHGTTEAWVYTNDENTGGIAFYLREGYHRAGPFSDTGLFQASATDHSPVFKKLLSNLTE